MREYSPQNGIIFWRIGPLQYRLPLLGECSRNPSVSVHQLALLWEAAFAVSDFFFWRLFQCVCPFHDGWFVTSPAHTALSVQQFLTKNGVTPMPHPLYLPDLTQSGLFCFVFPEEKSTHKETFCRCGRGETKNSRSTKRHQHQWVQKVFWAVEKTSG